MHLAVSPYNPINAIYRDTESGVEQYKVQTEIKVHDSITKISRRIDSDVPRRDNSEEERREVKTRFGLLARISWRFIGSTVIQFGGRQLDTATLFRNKGFGLFGWEPEFTAHDGKEYIWRKKINRTVLEVNDKSATVVAEYKGKSMGIIGKARTPSLEIFPPFDTWRMKSWYAVFVIDFIKVTFIYIEKTRKS
ncbi:hypothetical protein K438DRAFT_1868287 [Mycena galopus ATCC 62051]|nr:hypothetical protein K438DRAFT_1868287 [Mycena galopus ATCC 62051]